jgi:hypothetical protein
LSFVEERLPENLGSVGLDVRDQDEAVVQQTNTELVHVTVTNRKIADSRFGDPYGGRLRFRHKLIFVLSIGQENASLLMVIVLQ